MPNEASGIHARRQKLLEQLSSQPFTPLDATLAETVPHGIGVHHGGMIAEERVLVEDAFRDGTLSMLTATCTLAAGVNLPASRVIFRSAETFTGSRMEDLDVAQYRQMAGRAGRYGQGNFGESFLLLPKVGAKQEALGKSLLGGTLPHVFSVLWPFPPDRACETSRHGGDTNGTAGAHNGMVKRVLETIAMGVTRSRKMVRNVVTRTLFAQQAGDRAAFEQLYNIAVGMLS